MMNFLQNITRAAQYVYQTKLQLFITVFFSGITIYLYYLAIIQGVSFQTFIDANKPFYVIAQIVFSIISALLIAMSISFLIFSIKQKQNESGISFLQVIGAMFFSIASTGCYVCGTILLPTVGLTASFVSLPFGGLEIKILSIFMILYSLNLFAKNILGICEIKNYKVYSLKTSSGSLNFSFKRIDNLKPIFITLTFILLIFTIPSITSALGFNKFLGANEGFVCVEHT